MKGLRAAFATGILVLVPLVATVDILVWFVNAVDHSARNYFPLALLSFDFRGLGLILAVALILITGALTQNFVGKSLVRLFDGAVRRIPLGGGIYTAIKKFLETVFNPQSDKFKGVVLVEFPRTGVYSIGFRTGKPDLKISKKLPETLANVFVPCTPNPTSGFYLLVPEAELVPLEISVQEAFKIVISMGIVTSDEPGVLPT